MPTLKAATFIDPKAALGELTPHAVPIKAVLRKDLGPSAPHENDEELAAGEPVARPRFGISPGEPPRMQELHYTSLLDEIWDEFDDPQERTAARLESLLDDVADEAQRVHLLAQDFWDNVPWYQVTDLDRDRYNAEFTAYLRRLNKYRTTLGDLEPDSTATKSVYVGLVQRAQGAGPVPDAIMHVYFAEQLGILADHADEMGEGFVGRVLDGLSRVDSAIDDARDAADEEADAFTDWLDEFTRPIRIGAWIVVGSIAAIAGVVLIDKVSDLRGDGDGT